MKHLNDYFNKFKLSRYRFGHDADLDWLVAFVFFVIVNIGLIIFTAVTYENAYGGDNTSHTDIVSNQDLGLLDSSQLKQVIGFYENERAKLGELSSSSTEMVDPSIQH